MVPHITGKPTTLKCSVPFSAEFPDILTVTSDDDGTTYFDASAYIESKKDDSLSVDKFFYHFRYLHYTLLREYKMDAEKTVLTDRNSHILIDVRFIYLFIFYVEPEFLAYVNDTLAELFANGVVFSDTYIVQLARERLPKDLLMLLANEPGEQPDGDDGGKQENPDASSADV